MNPLFDLTCSLLATRLTQLQGAATSVAKFPVHVLLEKDPADPGLRQLAAVVDAAKTLLEVLDGALAFARAPKAPEVSLDDVTAAINKAGQP